MTPFCYSFASEEAIFVAGAGAALLPCAQPGFRRAASRECVLGRGSFPGVPTVCPSVRRRVWVGLVWGAPVCGEAQGYTSASSISGAGFAVCRWSQAFAMFTDDTSAAENDQSFQAFTHGIKSRRAPALALTL